MTSMKIYTRTGDEGETGLFGGGRVLKCDPRLATCGALDELNALLGWCKATGLPGEIDSLVGQLQQDIFALGAELASPHAKSVAAGFVSEADVSELERRIDQFEARLPELRAFILPGGSPAAAGLHVARAVCRRAERDLVALAQAAPVRPVVLSYVNRLSDLLFVLARAANAASGDTDVLWEKKP
jgi:cob(I)alamin adenosyltransferase